MVDDNQAAGAIGASLVRVPVLPRRGAPNRFERTGGPRCKAGDSTSGRAR